MWVPLDSVITPLFVTVFDRWRLRMALIFEKSRLKFANSGRYVTMQAQVIAKAGSTRLHWYCGTSVTVR